MKKILLFSFLYSLFSIPSFSISFLSTPPFRGSGEGAFFKVNLWSEGETSEPDYNEAVLHCFLPAEPTGKAVIACPGGAYLYLCMTYEGCDFAPILNKEGIALFVLQYRVPKGRTTVPLADAQKAMRYVRSHAAEWGIKEVGIMGSSAGGHLATTASTHFTDSITRPDFQVLLYPVVSMQDGVTHKESRLALLGNNPTQSQKDEYSNERHVTKQTPRAFIVLSSNDRAVIPKNSLDYAQALVDNGVPVDLHIYEGGYHGFGCRTDYSEYGQWIGELLYWLNKK